MFGFRADGKKVKRLDPIQKIMPHIMKDRHDSMNMCKYEVDCEAFDNFIREQRKEGYDFNYMHLVAAGLLRTIALYPRLNRFIMNGRIYQRNEITLCFIVKKNLSATAVDSNVKIKLTGHESIYDIKEKIDSAIKENSKESVNNGTEKLSRRLTTIPNFIIKIAVGLLKWFDKHGLLPKKVIDASPMHTSLFITNLKSIKGEYIYHHVYDFGTTGLFASMGTTHVQPVVNENNEIVVGKVMPIGFVTDERFCDGFYFVNALKQIKRFWKNPNLLTTPLENLPSDEEVNDVNSRRYKKKMKKLAKKNKED